MFPGVKGRKLQFCSSSRSSLNSNTAILSPKKLADPSEKFLKEVHSAHIETLPGFIWYNNQTIIHPEQLNIHSAEDKKLFKKIIILASYFTEILLKSILFHYLILEFET